MRLTHPPSPIQVPGFLTPARSALGHEDPFPPFRLNARCPFSSETFRHVRGHDQGATVEGSHFGRGAFRVGRIQIGHDDVRAHTRQFERGRTADATASAGDDCDVSIQLHLKLRLVFLFFGLQVPATSASQPLLPKPSCHRVSQRLGIVGEDMALPARRPLVGQQHVFDARYQ